MKNFEPACAWTDLFDCRKREACWLRAQWILAKSAKDSWTCSEGDMIFTRPQGRAFVLIFYYINTEIYSLKAMS